MKWQTMLAALFAIPVLALFAGIGFLMWQIGEKWDARSTDTLIAGLVATCGGGVVIIGVLLAVIVGIPFAIRMFDEAGMSRRSWADYPPSIGRNAPPAIDGQWRTLPNNQPPWGATGGGDFAMLPEPQQDRRFSMDVERAKSGG